MVAVSAKIKDQEDIETKSLSSIWKLLIQVKVRDTKSNVAAYQYVDEHNKLFYLSAIKTMSGFKHRFGIRIAGWKCTHKIKCL